MERKIVIDPGHGGFQPGGMNRRFGILEKDIVLKMAEYMKEELIYNYPSINFRLTRNSDISVSLRDRCEMANDFGADLFISIHTNARLLKGKYGLEIETYHDENSVNGRKLATIIQKNLVNDTICNVPTIDRGVKTGRRWSSRKGKWMPFYVLRHTAMPAVLVELGFLSDNEEAIILTDPDYQNIMGIILAQSVDEYFRHKEV